MTYEIVSYVILLFIASTLAVLRKQVPYSRASFAFYMITAVTLSVVVRQDGLDVDMAQYAIQMHSASLDQYFIKEPIFWLGSRVLLYFLGDEAYVFYVFDIIVFSLVYFSFKNLKAPYYALLAYLCFFPFVLGMQNVYRQWISASLILLSYSQLRAGSTWRWILPAIFSAGSHNAAALFWPVITSARQSPKFKAAFWTGLALAPVAIIGGLDSKSSADTGANLAAAYSGMLILFLAGYSAISRGVLRSSEIDEAKLMLGCTVVVIAGVVLLTPAGAERLGMYSLMIIYPILAKRLDALRPVAPIRVLFVHFGFWPIMLFGTSSFLTTAINN